MPDPQFALTLDPKKLGQVPPMATTLDPDALGKTPDALAAKPEAEDPGAVASMWHWMNSPLAPQIAQAAHAVSQTMDTPHEGIPPALAQMRGFQAGVTEGIGNVASSLTSPISLVLLATGIGPESDLARRLPAVQKLLQLPQVQALYKSVHGLAGAGFAGHGAYTAATAPTLAGKAEGVAEFAMGASGAAHAAEGTLLSRPVGRGLGTPETPSAPPTPQYLPHRAPGPRLLDPTAQAAADEALQRQYFTAMQDPRTPGAGAPPPDPSAQVSPWEMSETRRREMMRTLGGQAGQINADPTAVQPTATFHGWQEGIDDIPPTPLYNVQGGPFHRSTVGPARLRELGIVAPDTPEMPSEMQGQFGGAEPGPETAHDEPVPSVRKPTWIRNEDTPGGRWVLPSGEFEAGPDARSAQTTMRDRGVDPFSKTGVTPIPTEPMGLATVPKEEPGWEQGAEGGMPGFYSPLRRMVEAIPDKGLPPARFLSMAEKVVSPDEMGWKDVRQWVQDYQQRNGNAPIPKADLQQLVDNTRIVIEQITQGDTEHTLPFTDIGELQPHPDSVKYSQPFPDYETWKNTELNESFRGPEYEESNQRSHAAAKMSYESQGKAYDTIKTIPVTTPTGERTQATIKPTGYDNLIKATLPEGVADSPVDEMGVGLIESHNRSARNFTSVAEAEAWIRERLKAGSSAHMRSTKWESYAVPGPVMTPRGGPTPRRKYREDLFTVPGTVPSNRVESTAYRNTAHYDDYNVVGTVRGQQDYVLPNPVDPDAAPVHGTLIDEAQSDIHQQAKTARLKEVKRLRDQAAKTLMENNVGLTIKQAREQTPLGPFDKQVPEDFGYRSKALGEQMDAAARDKAATEEVVTDLSETLRGLKSDLRTQLIERKSALVREAGFANISALQDAADTSHYPSISGGRYGAAWVEDMSPEDVVTYTHAKQVLDHVATTNASTPEIQALDAQIQAVNEKLTDARAAFYTARERHNTLRESASDAVGGALPYKGEAWHSLVAKRKIYQVAADPTTSFIGIVGGLENAERYNYARSFSKVRFNPERQTLHAYDPTGNELRGTWGGQGEAAVTMPAPIDTSTPAAMQKDLARYLPQELVEKLLEKVEGYEPVIKPGEKIERQRAGYSGDPGDDDYRTNDPDDADRWGTRRERERARENWAEREQEAARENERESWSVEEEATDELDLEAEENEPYIEATNRAQELRAAYVAKNQQPLLPGFEDWTPEEISYLMFPDPEVPEDAAYVMKWRAKADWMGREELTDDDHLFDTEAEADRHVDNYVDSASDFMDIDYPSDEELYGPDGADLTDHYDRNFDPDADPDDEDTPEEYGPGTIDPAAHPSLEGLDLKAGGKGMFTFYDEVFKSRIERLLRPFGFEGEMQKTEIPSNDRPGETTYAWVAYLTPEMKAKIAKAGFSIMSVALAVKDTQAPQAIKDRLLRLAIMDARRNKQADRGPGQLGTTPTPAQALSHR